MKNLLEYQINPFKILAERKTDEGTEQDVEVKWQHANIINNNNRRYRKKLLAREIDRIQSEIDAGKTVWGNSYHPADGIGRAQDISHKWKKIWMEDDGTCKGVLTLVPTEAIKTMMTLVRVGKIGISSRGFGTTAERRDMIGGKKVRFLDVNDDYQMKTPGDFVVAPSVAGAGNITEELSELESRLNEFKAPEDKGKKIEMNEPFVEILLQTMYSTAIDQERFSGSLEDYKKETEPLVRAEILCQDGHFQSTEEALEYLGEQKLAKQMTEKPKQERVTPAQVWLEARIANVDAKVFAEQINKQVEIQEREDDDFQPEQITRIVKEALQAGVDLQSPEERERFFAIHRKQKHTPTPNSLDERAETIVEKLRRKGDTEVTIERVVDVLKIEDQEKAKKEKIQRRIAEEMLAGKGTELIK